MPEGFQTHIDDQVLQKVIDLAKKKKTGDFDENGEPSRAYASYLEQLVLYATGEDRIWGEPQSLLSRAANAWKNSRTRKTGESKIDLRIEDGRDWTAKRLVLDIVTEDKPFLVDSLSAALSEAGKPVSFFFPMQ